MTMPIISRFSLQETTDRKIENMYIRSVCTDNGILMLLYVSKRSLDQELLLISVIYFMEQLHLV